VHDLGQSRLVGAAGHLAQRLSASALLLGGERAPQRRGGDGLEDLELSVAHLLARHLVAADARIEGIDADVAAGLEVDGLDADGGAKARVLALGVEEPALTAEDELTEGQGLEQRRLARAHLAKHDGARVGDDAGGVPLPCVRVEVPARVQVASDQHPATRQPAVGLERVGGAEMRRRDAVGWQPRRHDGRLRKDAHPCARMPAPSRGPLTAALAPAAART
jgi:hypothetical protein